MRHAVALLAGVAVALTAAGCGESERDRVEAYIKDANAVQKKSEGEFKRANRAYLEFSRGRLAPSEARRDLARAQQAMRATRARLFELEPPPEAHRLHALLLRVFDVNADFAGESTALARYLPAAAAVLGPLDLASELMRRRLAGAEQPRQQARALARYGRGLGRLRARLRRLRPPPVLVPAHRSQLERLTRTEALARRLRSAVVDRDARRVARLLVAFRRLNRRERGRSALSARSVRAYRERHRRVTRQRAALQRELLRLQRELG